jgi:putative membrane protein
VTPRRAMRELRAGFAHSRGMNINHPSPASPVSRRFQFVTAACLAAFVPLFAAAQTRTVDTPVRDGRVVEMKKSDRDFLEKAAKASMSEVAISRVAAARTSNPDVRRFAQMMVEDHDRANDQITSLAASRGVALPAKDPAPEKWEKRDAKDFDKAYLDQMVSDHEEVVKLFEKQAKDGHDVEAVAFARKHLPKMQAHLQHALDLKRALTEKRR